MTDRLTNLVAAEQMISGIRTLTEVYQTTMSNPENRANRIAEQVPVNEAADKLIVFLRENFGADEALIASINAKPSLAPVALRRTEDSPYTAEEHQLIRDVKAFISPAGDTPYSPSFDAETLVNERDATVVVAAMKYLLSAAKAPLNGAVSKEFGPFAALYKGVIL